jgi:hypothetical protein
MSQQRTSDEPPTPDPSPSPRPSAVAQLNDYRRNKEIDPDLGPLRRQVTAIIEAILTCESPEDGELREALRRHVARNPGRPEKALFGHLITLSDRQDEAG